jgi:hypothetical protein
MVATTSTVPVLTTGRVVGSCQTTPTPVRVTLHYTPRDPYAITLLIPAWRRTWVLARDLLRDGRIGREVTSGTVTVTRGIDPGEVCISRFGPGEHAMLWIADHDIMRFLAASYHVVPSGDEPNHIDWSHTEAALNAVTAAPPRRVLPRGSVFHAQIPDGVVYVGPATPALAGSPYANPHWPRHCRRCGLHHDQADAVRAYALHLADRPLLVAAARRDLAGRDLACWCALADGRGRSVPCHADVLLEIANG